MGCPVPSLLPVPRTLWVGAGRELPLFVGLFLLFQHHLESSLPFFQIPPGKLSSFREAFWGVFSLGFCWPFTLSLQSFERGLLSSDPLLIWPVLLSSMVFSEGFPLFRICLVHRVESPLLGLGCGSLPLFLMGDSLPHESVSFRSLDLIGFWAFSG